MSEEIHVFRHLHGIKLVHHKDLNRASHCLKDRKCSLQDLLNLSFPVGFVNHDGAINLINKESASQLGFNSEKSAISKTIFDIADSATAKKVTYNNNQVTKNAITQIFDEQISLKNGDHYDRLIIKSPWYNEDSKVVGFYGFHIVLGKHSLSDSLRQIISFGLLEKDQISHSIGRKVNDVYLTKRELECLKLTVRGYSAKAVAKILGLSQRTVEYYLENIKDKFSVSSKSELIDRAFDYIYRGIL